MKYCDGEMEKMGFKELKSILVRSARVPPSSKEPVAEVNIEN